MSDDAPITPARPRCQWHDVEYIDLGGGVLSCFQCAVERRATANSVVCPVAHPHGTHAYYCVHCGILVVRAMTPDPAPVPAHLLTTLSARIEELYREGAIHLEGATEVGHFAGPDPECSTCDSIYGEANLLRDCFHALAPANFVPPDGAAAALQALVDHFGAHVGHMEEGIEHEEFARRLNRAGAEALGTPFDDSDETPMPFTRIFKADVQALRECHQKLIKALAAALSEAPQESQDDQLTPLAHELADVLLPNETVVEAVRRLIAKP